MVDVFVGHGVMFINDLYPRATEDGRLQTEADWQCVPTRVQRSSDSFPAEPASSATQATTTAIATTSLRLVRTAL